MIWTRIKISFKKEKGKNSEKGLKIPKMKWFVIALSSKEKEWVFHKYLFKFIVKIRWNNDILKHTQKNKWNGLNVVVCENDEWVEWLKWKMNEKQTFWFEKWKMRELIFVNHFINHISHPQYKHNNNQNNQINVK